MQPDKETIYYACDDPERLEYDDPDEAIDAYLSNLYYLPETITLKRYSREEMHDPTRQVESLVEDLLEILDEEYGNPDSMTELNEGMRAAAKVFAKEIHKHYRVWSCKVVGEEEVDVRKWAEKEHPEWIENEQSDWMKDD